MPRHRQNGERYPSGKLKHANGDDDGAPVDAVAKWVRQRKAVELEILDRRWGSQIGKLNRFGHLSDHEMAACFRWADLQRRAYTIRGIPSATVRAASYDPTEHCRSEVAARPITKGEAGALEAADAAHKAVMR